MKAILIRVAIILFVRWLRRDKYSNEFVVRIKKAVTTPELIAALEHKSTKDDISDIVTDIEDETVSTIMSDIIEGK